METIEEQIQNAAEMMVNMKIYKHIDTAKRDIEQRYESLKEERM